MCIYWDPRQLDHDPARELCNGVYADYNEHPGRAHSILEAVGETLRPDDHGEAPLLRVHPSHYLDFLKSAHSEWLAAGRIGDAHGYVWPAVRRRDLAVRRIDAKLGQYSIDATSPIAAGTWTSAYWSAQTALSALDSVLAGERTAFALCRPPGHHAGADYLGGYCYLNSAAIAAEAGIAAGRPKVTILEIDYHHGNGTQDIFYARSDVLFVSIHADPGMDYPYYWGWADERGEGAGEGATLNLPLLRGTQLADYEKALGQALETVAAFGPDLLILSYGAGTYARDPISFFNLETRDYPVIARRIAELRLPTLVLMEGGYAVDDLGANVAAFLSGL